MLKLKGIPISQLDFDLTVFETLASKSYSKDEKNAYDFTIEYRKRKEV